MNKRFQRLILIGLCFAIAGCVSAAALFKPPTVPLAPERTDGEAKRFRAPPGKAAVYVIRANAWIGQGSLFQISLDGKDQGKLSKGTYFLFALPSGKHVIGFRGVNSGSETIYAVEGGIYYLEIRAKSGLTASSADIFRVDRQRGQNLVLDGKRAGIKASR